MRLIKDDPHAAERANKLMLDFLLKEGMTLSDDKYAKLGIVCIDLFFDWATQVEDLKEKQPPVPREEISQIHNYLGGVQYVLCMQMGNDVLFYSPEDKLRVFTRLREAFYQRLTDIRVIQHVAHILESLFAYQKFGDDEDLDDSDLADGSEADESFTEEKNVMIKDENGENVNVKVKVQVKQKKIKPKTDQKNGADDKNEDSKSSSSESEHHSEDEEESYLMQLQGFIGDN